jgi:Tfp pilus assembly protein PilP
MTSSGKARTPPAGLVAKTWGRFVWPLMAAFLCCACQQQDDDLRAWIAAQKNKPPALIAPSPNAITSEASASSSLAAHPPVAALVSKKTAASQKAPALNVPNDTSPKTRAAELGLQNAGPFADKQLRPVSNQSNTGHGVAPDFQRRKESLEAFALEALQFVGVLQQGDKTAGIIKSPQGSHSVQVGRYVGQNHGQVQSVSHNQIVLREIIQVQDGAWTYKITHMKLQEAGS